MEYKDTFTKEQAIDNAELFLVEVKKLEEKFSMSFNSDTGDIYLSYKPYEGVDLEYNKRKHWDTVKIGWIGDGTGIRVMEKKEDYKKVIALAKLTDEEKELLGLV